MFRIPLSAASAALATTAVLVGLSVVSSAAVWHADALVSAALHAHAGGPLLAAGFAVTLLGGTDVVIPLTLAAVVALVLARRVAAAAVLGASVVLTQGVVALLKALVERPRPAANAEVAGAAGFSFPSGHSATIAALFGVLALVAARTLTGRLRVLAVAASLGVIVAVGASRVLLGAHYPTDVLAGWLTGGAVALGSAAVAKRLRAAAARRRGARPAAPRGSLRAGTPPRRA